MRLSYDLPRKLSALVFAAVLACGGGSSMKLLGATSRDGIVYAHVDGAWQAVGKSAAHPFFRPGIEGGNIAGARLSRPFELSPWVQQGIKIIASQISSVPLQFAEDARGGKKQLSDPNLRAFWERPGRDAAGTLALSDFLEATVGWLKLKGECFWIMGDEWLVNRFATKREPMIVARPDRMREVMKGGKLAYWQFTDADGKQYALLPEQVVFLRFWNPYDPVRGMSEYSAASTAAEADYLAANFARNLMRNNGDRGEYVIAKTGMPSEAQRDQIIAMLRSKREAASRGEFKPAFLTGDISIEDPKIAAPDAAFVAQRLENRHEVAIAFGIPPSMFDLVASYSVGSASDWFRLLHSTCIPLANGKIADGMEMVTMKFLTGRTKPIFASFCFDEHPTMQQVRKERLDAADKLWAKGMPMEKINEYLQLGMPEFPGWDVGYLPFGVAPVGEDGLTSPDPQTAPEYSEDQPTDEVEEENAFEKVLRLMESREPVRMMEAALQIGARTPAQKGRDPKRLAQWRELMAKQRTTEAAFISKITKALQPARAEVLRKLEQAKKSRMPITRAGAADFMFDLEAFQRGLWTALRKIAASALQTAGEQLFAEIGVDDPFSMPSPQAMAYLKIRENRIKDASEEMFNRVKSQLEKGLDSGESIEDLADRVRTTFNGISKSHARTIASTETSAAYGVGRQRAMENAGVTHKQWLTSGNDNVRAAHLEADGQIVPTDQAFDVGGEKLMNPGDPTGSPENVINCRCVAIAVSAPDNSDK